MNKKKFFSKLNVILVITVMCTAVIFAGCSNDSGSETTDKNASDEIAVGEIINNGDGTFTTKVNANNPILAGYHADPSAYKFGDTYYIYPTTDGYILNGNAGWPMIWKSRNFVDWEASPMELLNENGKKYTPSEAYFWAPTMLHWNEKYYLFFTQDDYFTMLAQGDSPEGPFTVLGNLFDTTNATRPRNKTIDSQAFLDDDGKAYLVYLLREDSRGDASLYTTICELDPENLTKVKNVEKIEELSHVYREGQELIKKDGKYYMLYSEGSWLDGSYHIKYAMSDSIYGPYTIKETILESPGDGRIIGTGHHSTLKDGDRYILVYHRQSIPFLGPQFRQVCADEISFNDDGTIKPVKASAEGVTVIYTMTKEEAELKNVAKNAKVITDEESEYIYRSENLVDESNATLWKTADKKGDKVVTLELDDVYDISKTQVYFEFGSKYYCYKIETSVDNQNWEIFADHSDDKTKGTPRADIADNTKSAKYVKLTITKTETLSRNYGSKTNSDPDRWKEPQRIGIFEFKVMGKKA